MRAVEFNKELIFHESYPVPEPQEGEALIKVHMAGICNTDIEIIKGYMDFSGVLGHEFVGTVEKINGDNQNLLNKRVVGEINCPCLNCQYCNEGLKNHCPARTVLGIYNRNGCFADYITLPINNLLEVPDNVSDEEAVIVEPLAAAFEIMEQVYLRPTDKILVLGDGKLGLLIGLTLNLSPGDVVLVGKHEEKLSIGRNQGVKTLLLNDLSISRDYDIVVEATGSITGFETAQKLVKPRGTIVLKSTIAENNNINLAPVVVDEINILGSRCGPFKPALTALEKGLIDVKPLISGTFGFNQAKEAIELSKIKGILKILLDFR